MKKLTKNKKQKFNYPIKTWADNFVLFKIYCGIELTGLNPYLLDQNKKEFNSTIELQKKFKKHFLLKRFLYKIKNKILKRFLSFDGHQLKYKKYYDYIKKIFNLFNLILMYCHLND